MNEASIRRWYKSAYLYFTCIMKSMKFDSPPYRKALITLEWLDWSSEFEDINFD